MYQLQNETETVRTYRSTITGTEVTTSVIYTDGAENKWWAFNDLLQIPHIRKMAANNVSQLYGVGFTQTDLTKFTDTLKEVLRSNDPEKYEKAYSEVLQLESIIKNNCDPVKQELGLCAIYILSDDERIDTFSNSEVVKKMEVWALDLDAQAFFLTWFSDGMNDFTKLYNTLIQTASMVEK